MKRRIRRRRRKRKQSTKFFKKWKRRFILIATLFGIIYLANFVYGHVYTLIMNYASNQTINIATLIIKEAIAQSDLVSFKAEDVLHFKENDEGLVSSVYINTPELNRLLVSATHLVEEKLLLVESGDLSELGLDAIYGGPYEDGILLMIPWTAAFNLSLLHEYGPRFPVTAKLMGNATTDIDTEVKPYGINNALLQIALKVSVKLKVTLPFKSEETVVSVSSPIVIKMITGQTPEYYYIGNSSASPISPFNSQSGNSNNQTESPDTSPEQNVDGGLENILLQ